MKFVLGVIRLKASLHSLHGKVLIMARRIKTVVLPLRVWTACWNSLRELGTWSPNSCSDTSKSSFSVRPWAYGASCLLITWAFLFCGSSAVMRTDEEVASRVNCCDRNYDSRLIFSCNLWRAFLRPINVLHRWISFGMPCLTVQDSTGYTSLRVHVSKVATSCVIIIGKQTQWRMVSPPDSSDARCCRMLP